MRWLAVLLLVAVAVAHAPGLRTGFLSDDFMILGHVHETGIAHQWTHSFLDLHGVRFFRPLLTTSYGVDHAVHGIDAYGFHVTNLLLHLIVVSSVIALGRQLGGGWAGGLLGGALIGFHALNANTVTWVAGRVSLLGVACSLVATVAFLAYRRRPRPLVGAAALVALLAGLLSKESTLLVPALWIATDVVLRGRRVPRFHVASFALLVVVLVVRLSVLGTMLGGYGGEPTAFAFGDIIATTALALAPFTQLDGAAAFALIPWAVVGAVWGKKGAPGRRGLVVAAMFGVAMVVVLYGSGLRMVLANAERWYPALAALALGQGLLCVHAGRIGIAVGIVAVLAGLPSLWRSQSDYREVGEKVRDVIRAVHAAPDAGPVFVHGLPIASTGAPFLHFGLREACAPPFRSERRDVLAIPDVYAMLGEAPHPGAWLLAKRGPVTAIYCAPDGTPVATLDREGVLAIPDFAPYERAARRQIHDGPSNVWEIVGGVADERAECFLITPRGTARFDRRLDSQGRISFDSSASAVVDFVTRDRLRLFVALLGGEPGKPRAIATFARFGRQQP